MIPGVEVCVEVWRIVEWRDGAIYRTEFVEERWVEVREDGVPVVPENHTWAPTLHTPRRKR